GFPGGGANPFGAGAPGGQGLAGQQPAPPANPNVQIPNFGKNPDKAQINQMLEAAAQKYGIPPNILKAVAWQESGWNPRALSFDGQHGKGIMQIDDRFHEFARTPDVFDPAKNIDYGARFLANLYKQTGSWSGALKRYNGGSSYPPKILALAEQRPWERYV
ncbi:MAG TPA: transglycosylase SLT domain-containing protein, partial [Candidatus Nitrosotenuis sp.]|nr:transglycosylase SLT domain-containing protein [Candidatus Nitrosotenuis sp.]